MLHQHPFNEILRAAICPGCLPKEKEKRRNEEMGGGRGFLVTETLVSQTPMGMSKGQKDTSLSKVRVKSPCRVILEI